MIFGKYKNIIDIFNVNIIWKAFKNYLSDYSMLSSQEENYIRKEL